MIKLRYIILLTLVIVSNIEVLAQKTEVRNLSSFDEINFQIPVELVLIQGKEEKIAIETTGFEPSLINSYVRREALTLVTRDYQKFRSVTSEKLPKVYLYFNKLLRIHVAPGTILNTQNTIRGFELRIKVRQIIVKRFDIDVSKFIVQIEPGGKLEGVTGVVGKLDLEVNMQAQFDGSKLLADFVVADVIDRGVANVNVKHSLHATIKTFGKLNYIGDPTELITKVKSGGKIAKLEQ